MRCGMQRIERLNQMLEEIATIAAEALILGLEITDSHNSALYNDTASHKATQRPHLVLIRSESDPGCQK